MFRRIKWIALCGTAVFCSCLVGMQQVKGQGMSLVIAGEKKDWHGFDRYDFVMDDETLAITAFKAPEGENFAIGNPAKGQHRCILVVPKKAAPGNPWSWRGCYWDHQPQTEIELLRRGFCVAYVSASATLRPGREWDAWYAFLTDKYGLSKKPAFVGMSRGGEFAYMWATGHPDKVSCIYADNPGMNRETLMKLGELAAADIPLLHVCGSIDPIFGDNTLFIESLYQRLGGRISLMIKEGFAHHPHSLRDPRPIVDFIEQSCVAAATTAANNIAGSTTTLGTNVAGSAIAGTIVSPPAFVGSKFTRSNYYGTDNTYRYFQAEGAYITCRGPLFTTSYDRYSFGMEGVAGSVVVTVPKKEATGKETQGKPWVFRAGFAGRDEVVDLALLAKGYYIVTGPVSFNSDSMQLKDWNMVYKMLTDHGFSTRPVLEGAGGAAGEVYGWAISNPDKVSCIYSENPLLRSTFSPAQPLDHLASLAKAGVMLLNVCGSLDPAFGDNTRVVQKRYQELGGTIRVVVKEGVGHYPLAPQDVGAVVDFVTRNTR